PTRRELHVRGEELHPTNPVFDLPVEPAALAVEAVSSEGGVYIRGEPGAVAARRPEPVFGELHQLPADAISLEFRKHRDDPELARGTIGDAKPGDRAILSAEPALVRSREFLGDTCLGDAKSVELLQRIPVLSRSRADVEQRRNVCLLDLPE